MHMHPDIARQLGQDLHRERLGRAADARFARRLATIARPAAAARRAPLPTPRTALEPLTCDVDGGRSR